MLAAICGTDCSAWEELLVAAAIVEGILPSDLSLEVETTARVVQLYEQAIHFGEGIAREIAISTIYGVGNANT